MGESGQIGDAVYHKEDQDQSFIAHSRTDIPALLDYIDKLREAYEILDRAVAFYEAHSPWRFPEGYYEINIKEGEGGHVKFGSMARDASQKAREVMGD